MIGEGGRVALDKYESPGRPATPRSHFFSFDAEPSPVWEF